MSSKPASTSCIELLALARAMDARRKDHVQCIKEAGKDMLTTEAYETSILLLLDQSYHFFAREVLESVGVSDQVLTNQSSIEDADLILRKQGLEVDALKTILNYRSQTGHWLFLLHEQINRVKAGIFRPVDQFEGKLDRSERIPMVDAGKSSESSGDQISLIKQRVCSLICDHSLWRFDCLKIV